MRITTVVILLSCHVNFIMCFDWSTVKLVRSHVPYVFSHQPRLKKMCIEDSTCPYKEYVTDEACWGFEDDCQKPFGHQYPTLDCANERSKKRYWNQADFGYVRKRLDEMNSGQLCKKTASEQASLRCTKGATMCTAQNLFIDLTNVHERIRDRDKVALNDGEIGGYCELNKNALARETSVKRDLSTWGEQLSPYTQLNFDPFRNEGKKCDIVLNKPVVFVQLDFGGNMYHHFCDFFNLYLTQLADNSSFGTDIQIIRWDMSPRYGELFGVSWKAFTDYDHTSLREYAGKRLCIRKATFAFLPRMAFGLFYSTPLEEHCRGTGLFRAFSEHFLHRIGIIDDINVPTSIQPTGPVRIRVTFSDRGTTDQYLIFRRVLNQDQLIAAMEKIPDFDVQVVKYGRQLSFEEQLTITRNTDLFIGMHGAGLAHFLFLPDWAVAFELYNCDDIRCYCDLSLLRGIRYLTWEDKSKVKEHDKNVHKQYGDHAKFWNFSFDVDEFMRLVKKARSWLLKHPRFSHLKSDHEEL